MFKNYLKIAFRNLIKNRVFVFINIIGLGIALSCCIVAYLNWEYNSKFDSHHTHADQIHRVNFIRNMGGRSIQNGSCPFPLAEAAQQNIDQVDQTARFIYAGGNFKVDNHIFSSSLSAVDPEFMDMFTFDYLEGDGSSIRDNTTLLVDEILKEKYWPNKSKIVGETITYIDGDDQFEFKIGGVFKKPPSNSSFQAKAYIGYRSLNSIRQWDMNDWSSFNSTFFRIKDRSNVNIVEEQLAAYVEIQNRAKEDYKVARYYLDPFVGMAVRAEREGTWNHWFSQSLPSAAAAAPGIMALLLLLIACFNFTNTSIAIANRRIKEIGIRKVMGSNKRQIIVQFLGENVLLTFLALLFGILLAAILVPTYSTMWVFLDIRFNIFQNVQLVGFLIVLLFFAALIAGSYPALYISRFQPTEIFRGTVKFSGTNLLTRILLSLQFAISLIAIICGFVFSQNSKYQEEYDMGFDMQSVLFAYVKDANGYRTFRNALGDDPRVKEVAGTRNNMTSSWYTDPIKVHGKELDVNVLDIGTEYLSVIDATILEGRNFIPGSEHDEKHSIIINEELARILEWDHPIDQRLTLRDTVALTVVGLVKDIYNDGALWDPLEPMVLRASSPDNYQFLVVKTGVKDIKEVKNMMDAKWKSIFPDEVSTVAFMEGEKAQSQEVNTNIRKLFVFLGLVAIILSVIGLFSMVSMNINKRLKEIGIRKILGASTGNIASKISREFIAILLISCVLGSVGGYYLAEMLMASIWAYHVPMTMVIFIVAIATLLIASIL
ncbi:MAG: ABC transporter permease, partial [Saprospiraceae bacterium]|nr:ABC transporter permease [Saprospiraceae bacterium]